MRDREAELQEELAATWQACHAVCDYALALAKLIADTNPNIKPPAKVLAALEHARIMVDRARSIQQARHNGELMTPSAPAMLH